MDARTRGLWMAVGAFIIWGLMPLYWHLLKHVPSLQVVLHRALWSALLVAAFLTLTRGRGWLRAVFAQPRLAGMLLASGLLIGFNWSLYVWAVNAGHVVESSLGYFINPLLNVVIGVVFLRERLVPAQWVAVVLAACGVLWLTFNYGSFPWIALALAGSFAMYGLIRRQAQVDAVAGLGVENLYLLLPAAALLAWLELGGDGGFSDLRWGWGTNLLLVLGGALTALPLIGFAYAVRQVSLSTVGLLQYLAPTLQLLCGVLVFGEAFGRDRAIGFAVIWAGLAVFAIDGFIRARRRVVAQQA
ncbi:EamA family transporter RarD [Luteimonas sp. MC1895]|uniref:EamA family transporter RarD n=1 Tax=Luteimonas sp. MC1895 TaxID=2819513 RepID=UPI0018F06776|nr:EamA family transporter RarD [Luteimonas sp. MC1895]MBJ6978924.1 EamA family transporter RarD [Luteimonas sp. MC1895]